MITFKVIFQGKFRSMLYFLNAIIKNKYLLVIQIFLSIMFHLYIMNSIDT